MIDLFTFRAVKRVNSDTRKACEALRPWTGQPFLALADGLYADAEHAQAIHAAIYPHGYGVRGVETGLVKPTR